MFVTVKGVNFFGPRSEFIMSGSDCGNVYFWDKHTESIVQWMNADENGVVSTILSLPGALADLTMFAGKLPGATSPPPRARHLRPRWRR